MNLRHLAAAALATALTTSLPAVDFHVTTAQEFQNALTTAAANSADDTIYLAAGFYQGNFSFTTAEANSLTVEAEPGLSRGDVTLDGAGVGGALNLSSSVVTNFVVRRLTISRNCGHISRDALRISTLGTVQINDLASLSVSQAGRGIHVVGAASLTIEDCEVSATGAANGQGILIEGVDGTITMNRNLVNGNVLNGDSGGGIRINGTNANNVVMLNNNTIQGNHSDGGGGGLYFGGDSADSITLTANTVTSNSECGIYIVGGTLVLANNQFTSNWSGTFFGACYFSGNSANLSNNTFTGNTGNASGNYWCSGDPIYLSCNECSIADNVFRSNSGQSPYYSIRSFALFWSGGTATISGNQFFDNSGGALHCEGSVSLTSNRFERNDGVGHTSAIDVSGGNATLIGNTVLDSRTSSGQAIALGGSSGNTLNFLRNRVSGGNCVAVAAWNFGTMRMADNLLVGNNQPNAEGVGAWLQPSGQLDFVNNTITGNSGGGGAGLRINLAGTSEVVHCYNNIIWGNTGTGSGDDVLIGGFGSRTEFYHNIVHDMSGVWSITGNNTDLAPVFFDPSNGDYHLRYNSPGIGAGDNAAPGIETIDLDGNARIQDGTVEIGCFEFSNTDFHPADANGDWVIDEAEFNAYAAAWKNDQAWSAGPSPVPADYVTRSGYLQQNGGAYHNDGGAKPVCWKPGAGN